MTTTAAGLRSLLTPVRSRLVLSLIAAGIGGAAGVGALVAVAAVLAQLLSPSPGRADIWWWLLAALIGVLARFWLRAASIRLSHLASYNLETILRRQLTEHLGRLPLGQVSALGAGAVKKVVQDDVRALHTAVGDIAPLLGFAVAGPIAAIGVMFANDWRLALAALTLAPMAWLSLRLGLRDQEQLRRAWADANEGVNSAAIELVQGMAVVRTFDAGVASSRRFHRRVDDFTEVMAMRNYTSRGPTVLARLFIEPLPTLLLILVVGFWLLGQRAVSVADLILFLLVGTVPVESMTPVAWLTHFIRDSSAAAERIGEVLAMAPMIEPSAPRTPGDGSVRFCGVRFSYPAQDGRPALDGVYLEIPNGSVCAFVGSSGAGKSTIVGLVARFWDVDEGSVEIGGADVRDIGSTGVLRNVTLVLQEPFLVHDTIRENIRLARPDATDAQVVGAATAARAHEFIVGDLADGYDTIVGERSGRLSGGQAQRITIARALLSEAPVVVLDEATAFVDAENEAAIQEAIARLCQDRTVLVVAHRLSTVQDADQIVVLDGGRIVERGTHATLLARDGRYASLWRSGAQASAWRLGARL